jgi:hypothetical protein
VRLQDRPPLLEQRAVPLVRQGVISAPCIRSPKNGR